MNKEEKVKSINKKIIIIDALIAVFAIAFVFAVVGYIKQEVIATAASVVYDEIRDDAVVGEHESVNFSTVKSKGSTATSWLYIPGTQIDYPLVQGPNNDYYITHDAYGNKSKAGAIFINFANAPDMSDAKTVIFGHNMSDGTMFTDLHRYADENFGQVHQDAYIYMESGEVKHYKLLYYLFTQPLDPKVYVVSKADVALEEAESIKEDADIVYNEATGNNIIALSTCTASKYRTVVIFEYMDDAKPIIGSSKKAESADVPQAEGSAEVLSKELEESNEEESAEETQTSTEGE